MFRKAYKTARQPEGVAVMVAFRGQLSLARSGAHPEKFCNSCPRCLFSGLTPSHKARSIKKTIHGLKFSTPFLQQLLTHTHWCWCIFSQGFRTVKKRNRFKCWTQAQEIPIMAQSWLPMVQMYQAFPNHPAGLCLLRGIQPSLVQAWNPGQVPLPPAPPVYYLLCLISKPLLDSWFKTGRHSK